MKSNRLICKGVHGSERLLGITDYETMHAGTVPLSSIQGNYLLIVTEIVVMI